MSTEVGNSFAARVAALAGDSSTSEASGEGNAPDERATAPANSGEVTSEASSTETPKQADPEAELREQRRTLLKEKIAKQRADRQAHRLTEKARIEREQLAAERKVVADERAALAEGRKDYKKFFEQNGIDARAAYDEMTRQAIEANTPEAQIRQLQAEWQQKLDALVTPLQAKVQEFEQREAQQRQQAAARKQYEALVEHYKPMMADSAYLDLRADYGDENIFDIIQNWDHNPESLYKSAKAYGVELQDPGKGFSMKEAFDVIKAAYDHDRSERDQRRARLIPANESPAATAAQHAPTVNGTAERRNAGSVITNELASSRASSGRRLSRQERVEAIARREERR